MKLATYRDGSRDGQLVVVSRDLSQAHYANGIASRLQQVLDDWNFLAPQLEDLSLSLNHGKARHAFAFEPTRCMAPLPRPRALLQGNAYAALQALLLGMPEGEVAAEPVLTRGPGEALQGPSEAVRLPNEALGLDFQPTLIAVCADLAQGAASEQALEAVRLLGLGCDWSLRQLAQREREAGQAPQLSQLACSLAPVLVTPEELGDMWLGGRPRGSLQILLNGRKFGPVDLGAGLRFGLGELIAQAARLKPLRGSVLVAAGPLGPAEPAPRQGWACLAHRRALEAADKDGVQTGFMKWGDSLRVDLKGSDGQSLFGAIDLDVLNLSDPDPQDAVPAAQAAAGGDAPTVEGLPIAEGLSAEEPQEAAESAEPTEGAQA